MFMIDKSYLRRSKRSNSFGMSRVAFYGSVTIVGIYPGESMRTYFRARFYCSPTSGTVRCLAHLSYGDISAHGVGISKGYGYDKQCAALADALNDMGFKPVYHSSSYSMLVQEIRESLLAVGVEQTYISEVFE